MNSPTSDTELGQMLRAKAASLGYSPNAFLNMAEEYAELTRWSVTHAFGPHPHTILEDTIGQEHLEAWPAWSAKLISVGCKIERLEWVDGRVTTRLLTPRGRVLAAFIEPPGTPE
jgi:hypothetical protein